MDAAQPPVRPGDILAGKYRVERVLGAGGMGIVVAATHLELREARAIKFMLPTALSDAEAVERFVREARAASLLKSEHVARVHDVGRLENGSPYMVMEHLEGTDLSSLLRLRGAFSPTEAVLYVLQASEALAEAHGRGIVHRDLKPANLFLCSRPDGTPCIKVLDFGISKMIGAAGPEVDLTKAHTVLGSPQYMSPEQMRSSRDVDGRSDIWSLGVILYVTLTAKHPFRGRNVGEIIASVFASKPAPPSDQRLDLSPELDAVIMRCLERNADARFPDVGELAQSLLPFAPDGSGPLVDSILRLVASPGRSAPSLPRVHLDGDPISATPRPASGPHAAQITVVATPAAMRPIVAIPELAAPGSVSGAWGATSAGAMFRPRASRGLLVAGFGAAVMLGVLLTWGFTRSGGDPPKAAAARASAAPVASIAPAPQVSAAPTETASIAPAPASASAAPSAKKPAPRVVDPFGMDRK